MILGLLIVCVKQRRNQREMVEEEHKQTLLTVDDVYRNDYIDINRSSADTGSIRESIEPTLATPTAREPQAAEVIHSGSPEQPEQQV